MDINEKVEELGEAEKHLCEEEKKFTEDSAKAATFVVRALLRTIQLTAADRCLKKILKNSQLQQRYILAQNMEVQLRRLGPHNQITVLTLMNGDFTWTAGRGSKSDIYILSRYVSRRHFSVKYRDNNFYLCDHGSVNGTFINDKRMRSHQEYPLPFDSIISVGVPSYHQNDPDCIVFVFEQCKEKKLVTKMEKGVEDIAIGVDEVHIKSVPTVTGHDGKSNEPDIRPGATEQFCQPPTSSNDLEVEIIEYPKQSDLTDRCKTSNKQEDNDVKFAISEGLCKDSVVTALSILKTEMIPIKEETFSSNSVIPKSDIAATSAEIDLFEPEGYADDELVHAFEAQTQLDEPVERNSQLSYSVTEDYIEISDSDGDEDINIKPNLGNINFIKPELEDEYDDDVVCLDIVKSENYPPVEEIKIEDEDEYTETDMKWMGKLFKTKEECCSFIQSQRGEREPIEAEENEGAWVDLISSCADELNEILSSKDVEEEKLLETTENIAKITPAPTSNNFSLELLDDNNSVVLGVLTLSQENDTVRVESQSPTSKKKRSPSPSDENKIKENTKRIKLRDPYEFEDDSDILKFVAKKRVDSSLCDSGKFKITPMIDVQPKAKKPVSVPSPATKTSTPTRGRKKTRNSKVDSLPMSEKLRIRDQRRKKLRELCSRIPPKEGRKDDDPKILAPLKVKITRKNRNEYLCEQIRNVHGTRMNVDKTPEKVLENRQANNALEVNTGGTISKDDVEERSSQIESQKVQEINGVKEGCEVEKQKILSNNIESNQLECEANLAVTEMQKSRRDLKSCIKKFGYAFMRRNRRIVPEKSVTFDMTRHIRYYETENKITKRTSSLHPNNGLKLTFEMRLLQQKYLIISEICKWNGIWLEECKKVPDDELPPTFHRDKLKSVQKYFPNHDSYLKTFIPLLLIELWFNVVKRWKVDNNGLYRIPAEMKSYSGALDLTLANLGRINCESRMEDSTIMPYFVREGDVVLIQLEKQPADGEKNEGKSKKMVVRIFGYLEKVAVADVNPKKRNPPSGGNSPTSETTKVLILEILVAKHRNFLTNSSTALQITGVYHATPDLNMCQAVSVLPKSPFYLAILTPNRPAMALSSTPSNEEIAFNGPLDDSQRELVSKLVSTCIARDHGVFQFQGGPGTGKTHVIIAFILQLLHEKQWKRNQRPLILYCAHSNVAVDHATLKLKNYRQSLNRESRYKLVRFGNVCSMKPEVRDVSTCSLGLRNDQLVIENRTKALKEKINALVADLETPNTLSEAAIDEKSSKLHAYVKERELLKSFRPVQAHEKRPSYESESFVIENADVICTTFVSSGAKMMQDVFARIKAREPKRKIICIVDEAMQSKEPETIVPLLLGITHLILVGDSRQLKSPVRCEVTQQYGLNQSLFWRILSVFKQSRDLCPVYTLKNQYRMCSAISELPSKLLYSGCLRDAVKIKNTFNMQEYVVLIDNAPAEASMEVCETRLMEIAANLISEVLNTMGDNISDNNFGVITCKGEHSKTLRSTLSKKLDIKALPKMEVNPIENVQGQEFDVVLAIIEPSMISSARANVALTRAKNSLILLISNPVYKYNKFLSKLAEDASVRGVSAFVDPYMEGPLLMKLVSKSHPV